jgi:hypothetical protein
MGNPTLLGPYQRFQALTLRVAEMRALASPAGLMLVEPEMRTVSPSIWKTMPREKAEP